MKVRMDGEETKFDLASGKEVTLKPEELKDLEELIKVLRAVTALGRPEYLIIHL